MRAIPTRLSECNWLAPRSLPRSLGFKFWCHCVKFALPSCCGPAPALGPSCSWKDWDSWRKRIEPSRWLDLDGHDDVSSDVEHSRFLNTKTSGIPWFYSQTHVNKRAPLNNVMFFHCKGIILNCFGIVRNSYSLESLLIFSPCQNF